MEKGVLTRRKSCLTGQKGTQIKLHYIRPGLFEKWIMLSTGKITIQWTGWFVLLTLIHWIVIYVVCIIQPLNN